MMTATPALSRSPHADEFLALLRERRSIKDFLPDPVPRELLAEALDAGRFAPNHKLTEPWRFVVIGRATQEALAPLWSQAAPKKLPEGTPQERRDEAKANAHAKWMSKPGVVIVSQVLDPDPVRREEDYAACACAIQNIQLAAWALGFGCQLSTNPATRDPALLQRAGVPVTERVVGFLFVGYPATVPGSRRKPLADVLRFA
jgi:nitroreductase